MSERLIDQINQLSEMILLLMDHLGTDESPMRTTLLQVVPYHSLKSL